MELPQVQVDRHLKTLIDRNLVHYNAGKLNKAKKISGPQEPRLRILMRGILTGVYFPFIFSTWSILQPGQAVYQDAGLPHAYLEGQNVEIMSNSDNVLRGGLTPKHVDVKELMKHVKFEPTIPNIITGKHGRTR